MAYLEVERDVRLYVQDVGRGYPVVLLAGFGMNHRVWERTARVLVTAGYRVVCVDQRGHGRSDKPRRGYSVARLAEDLRNILEQLDIRGCALAGWSFGGQVAFELAAQEPGLVESLVLIASNAVRSSRSPEFPFGVEPETLERILVPAEQEDRLRARYESIRSGFAAPPGERTIRWLVDCSLSMPTWAAVECYRSMLYTDLLAELPLVKMPVLQVIGSADPVHSSDGARWLARRLPAAKLVEIDGCGHYPMIEAPVAFDAALLEFLTVASGRFATQTRRSASLSGSPSSDRAESSPS